jgi:antirestriction protein
MSALKGFITNLGLYNEGELVGEWIDFPISDEELEKVKDRIGIDSTHEEWFFTDYESDIDGFDPSSLGEYESIEHLNEIGEALETVQEDGLEEAVGAALSEGYDFMEAIKKASDGEIHVFDDIYNDMSNMEEAIGYYFVDAVGGVEELDDDTREMYFDYDSYGRDVRLEYYQEDEEMPETAGEYWCGDENATDEEIGYAIVEELGWDGVPDEYKENYFDYEGYGLAIETSGHFCRHNGKYFEIEE